MTLKSKNPWKYLSLGLLGVIAIGLFAPVQAAPGNAQSGWQAVADGLQSQIDAIVGGDFQGQIDDIVADLTTHSGDTDAHHTKYTDAEAVAAVGPHTIKYTDAEAVAAVGSHFSFNTYEKTGSRTISAGNFENVQVFCDDANDIPINGGYAITDSSKKAHVTLSEILQANAVDNARYFFGAINLEASDITFNVSLNCLQIP
jgi:hypothetical protein